MLKQELQKQTIKVADLLQMATPVEVDKNKQIMVRALSLKEMIELFMGQTENFLSLYAHGLEGKTDVEALTPFLLACPDLIAKIIAVATDEPDAFEAIESRMPATVQLIALQEIWKLSVPDPKKAQELLSVVMALLQKLDKKGSQILKEQESNKQQKILQVESSQA